MPKRVLRGRVVSDKNDKTVTVEVERRLIHPVYRKFIRKTKRYHAHDEANAAKIGDFVAIVECAPKSRLKRWEIMAEPATGAAAAEGN
ncbi:MAG: 30S ribosomal protein S17 [Alphaproteobacteria bacterium]|jgi:small subunit ribosomal protein S17|nr:30S ribosomal protein S17 [Alphaproteobacteria bacterium]